MIIVGILLLVLLLAMSFIFCLGGCQMSNLSATIYDKQLNDELQMTYLSNL